MIKVSAVVNNLPKDISHDYPYIVCTVDGGELWYFSQWETYDEALRVCKLDQAMLGKERVVLEIE